MKKLFLSLFVVLSALPAFSQVQNLRIFYVNGIGNTRPQAEDGARALQNVLSSLTNNVRVDTVYNPIGLYGGGLSLVNGGDTCDTFNFSTGEFLALANTGVFNILSVTESTALSKLGTCILGDLGELAKSKINEENYDTTFEAFKPSNLTADSQAAAIAFVNAYLVQSKEMKSVLSPSLDIANRAFRAIKTGNKVLIVAHSQGNLIVNLAWARLVASLSLAELNNIRILNVANTSIFSVHDADITHDFDYEISINLGVLGRRYDRNTPRCAQTGAAQRCVFRVVRPTYTANSGQGLLALKSWDNHNFKATYLSGYQITKVSNGQQTSFADAVYSATRSLLESMSAIAPIPPAQPSYAGRYACTYSGTDSGTINSVLPTAFGNLSSCTGYSANARTTFSCSGSVDASGFSRLITSTGATGTGQATAKGSTGTWTNGVSAGGTISCSKSAL